MRKLFWGCTTCGVVLAGGVISTAHFAVRHPESFIGKVLHGASYAAAIVNPISGLRPIVAQSVASNAGGPREAVEEAVEEPVPADPVPVEEGPLPGAGDELVGKPEEPGPIVVANSGSAPIVIPETDQQPSIPVPPMPQTADLQPSSFNSAECPPSAATGAAPKEMLSCEAAEDCELLGMPAPILETLPMPRAEEEQEGCSCGEKEKLLDLIKRCIKEQGNSVIEMMKPCHVLPPDCPKESDCGGKGCTQPCPADQPKMAPCKPSSQDSTKPDTEGASAASSKSVRRKLSIFRHDSDSDEVIPSHPEVDTMEFRPSDRHLSDYGPGPL